MLDGRQRVDGDRQTGSTVGNVDGRVGVDECHLCLFVVVLVVHVVNDVHGIIVNARNLLEHQLVVFEHLVVVEHVRGECGYAFEHNGTSLFATAAVDGQQQGFGQVAACAEELDLLADGLV